jgi:hypothetical protein
MFESRMEFIKAWNAPAGGRNKGIDCDIEDVRGLAQARLLDGLVHSSGILLPSECLVETKKDGQIALPAS